MTPETTHPLVRRTTLFVAVAVFVLLVAGALVTSTGSGLAVPDWPLSYGKVMPPMVGGIKFEHGHRLIAAAVSTLVGVQVAVLLLLEKRKSVRVLGILAFVAILLQAVLGGLTVIFQLPPAVSSAHAALAEIVFALTATIALMTSRLWPALDASPSVGDAGGLDRAFQLALAATATTYVQIVLGAVMRHTSAGLAIPDAPTVFGGLWPSSVEMRLPGVPIHLAHRVGAVFVTVLVALAARALSRLGARAGSVALLWVVLVVTQGGLGAFSIWTRRLPLVTATHLGVGALCFVTGLLATVALGRLRAGESVNVLTVDGPHGVPA